MRILIAKAEIHILGAEIVKLVIIEAQVLSNRPLPSAFKPDRRDYVDTQRKSLENAVRLMIPLRAFQNDWRRGSSHTAVINCSCVHEGVARLLPNRPATSFCVPLREMRASWNKGNLWRSGKGISIRSGQADRGLEKLLEDLP